MANDKQFSIDTKEDVFYIGITALVLVLAFSYSTHLDAQVRFLFEDFQSYFSESQYNNSLVFKLEDVEFANRHSKFALGFNAQASERLYCFSVSNNQVQNFRSADIIRDSSVNTVEGVCVGETDGIMHSQPGRSSELSEEDKDLESDIDYTCIHYSEIVESPVSKEVAGINCWEVVGDFEDPEFEQIGVVID